MENTGIDTAAVNSHEACTLIYRKQCCKFAGLTKHIRSNGIRDFDTNMPCMVDAGEHMSDG